MTTSEPLLQLPVPPPDFLMSARLAGVTGMRCHHRSCSPLWVECGLCVAALSLDTTNVEAQSGVTPSPCAFTVVAHGIISDTVVPLSCIVCALHPHRCVFLHILSHIYDSLTPCLAVFFSSCVIWHVLRLLACLCHLSRSFTKECSNNVQRLSIPCSLLLLHVGQGQLLYSPQHSWPARACCVLV